PLHRKWLEVIPSLTAKKSEEAEAAFQRLQSEILLTPDLTEADRLIVLAAYQKLWVDISEALAAGQRVRTVRGPTDTFRGSLMDEIDLRKSVNSRSTAEIADRFRRNLKQSSNLTNAQDIQDPRHHLLDQALQAATELARDVNPDPKLSGDLAAAFTAT